MQHRRTPLRPLAMHVLAASVVAACGAGDRADTAPVVRDSAGITIVENSAPAWRPGEGWRIAAEPEVEIGVLEGEAPYQLYRVRDAVRLPDGRIVIANGGSNELRYFAPDGRWLGTVVLPRGFNPTEIGEEYILGIQRDDLGVERVRLHRIVQGG